MWEKFQESILEGATKAPARLAASLNVSVTADADAVPDVEVLREGIADGFAAVGAVWRTTDRQDGARSAPR